MREDYCELQFSSEPLKVRNMVRRLLDFVDSHNPCFEARADLKLIFSELLCNAVFHGNKEDRSKRVFVRLETVSDKLKVSIWDEGVGFDYRKVMAQALSGAAIQNEHGRGIVLVRSLTDNLSYNETGNQVRFEKRLK